VGSGIVRSFILKGASVIVPSRSKENIEKLRGYVKNSDRLFIIEDDIGNEAKVLDIKKTIVDKFGSVDHLVTCLGAVKPLGPITKIPIDDVRIALHDLMISTLVVARTFLPLIADKQGSSYTNITGVAGERVLAPHMALTTVGAAALFGLSLALREEFRDKSVRVNEYRLALRVVRDEDIKLAYEHPHTLLGEHVVSVIESGVRDSVIRVDKTEQLHGPFKQV